jgi:hypothetical protein
MGWHGARGWGGHVGHGSDGLMRLVGLDGFVVDGTMIST